MVPAGKISDYLLNVDHAVGGAKAAFFNGFGFSRDAIDVMTAALVGHPDRNSVEATTSNLWGTTHVVRCSVASPDGRNPCIRSVWIVPPGETSARLVTAYPG
jgi:filamentous hemagglutinin